MNKKSFVPIIVSIILLLTFPVLTTSCGRMRETEKIGQDYITAYYEANSQAVYELMVDSAIQTDGNQATNEVPFEDWDQSIRTSLESRYGEYQFKILYVYVQAYPAEELDLTKLDPDCSIGVPQTRMVEMGNVDNACLVYVTVRVEGEKATNQVLWELQLGRYQGRWMVFSASSGLNST